MTTTTSAAFVLPEEGVSLEAVEKSFMEQALARTNGNQSQAAKLLGISRYALRYRAGCHGLIDVKDVANMRTRYRRTSRKDVEAAR